jgi:iron complex outermembrane receptor protein
MKDVRTAARSLAIVALLALAVSGLAWPDRALAQTQLPSITVTTPSPVAKPQARAARPAAPTQATPSAPATPSPEPATAIPPVRGIIVEDAFAPVTVVDSAEITSTPGATLADSLQYQPGITASNFAPGSSRPIIRGLDNFRVRVQENGIGSHDVSALSEDHAVPIDPFSADRIEVVRGPATLRYGSQAIGGVVNAINDRIPEIIPPRGFSVETRSGLTSGNDGADGAFKVTAGAGNFAVHADAFSRHANDYDTPLGRMRNSFVDNEGFSVGGSFVGPNGFAGIAFTRYEALYGIPGEDARIDMLQDKMQSRGEWRVNSGGVEAIRYWFGISDYEHQEIVPGEGIGSIFTNKESEGRVEIQHMPVMTAFGELRGAVGTQFGRRKTIADSLEGDDLLAPARTNSIAAFIFEELQMTRRLRFQAAARIEHTTVDGTGLVLDDTLNTGTEVEKERTFRPISASTGLLYELPAGVVARLTGQYVERAPDAAELFSKGVHEATQTFEIGNPFLDNERAVTFELGFRKAKGPFRFDASVYHTQFNGFIFKQLTGAFCDEELATCGPAGELKQVLYEQRDATFTGAELMAQYDIAPIWRGVWGIDGQYDFVRARFTDAEDGNVPRIPPHRIGAGVYYRDHNWFARVGFLHAFDQNKIAEFETSTNGYTLLNADLAYTFKLPQAGLVPEMTIGLKGENLLDDEVRNHVSFLKDEVLQPGRTIRLYGIVKLN